MSTFLWPRSWEVRAVRLFLILCTPSGTHLAYSIDKHLLIGLSGFLMLSHYYNYFLQKPYLESRLIRNFPEMDSKSFPWVSMGGFSFLRPWHGNSPILARPRLLLFFASFQTFFSVSKVKDLLRNFSYFLGQMVSRNREENSPRLGFISTTVSLLFLHKANGQHPAMAGTKLLIP